MMKTLRALAALLAMCVPAAAQVQQLPTGTVLGNATGGRALAIPSTVTAILDRAISGTQGAVMTRNGSAWIGLGPGTSGLPLVSGGAAANLAYAILGLSGGGSGANLTASTGGIVYSGASALAILSGTATAGQIVRSGASAAPTWSTASYPATIGAGQVLAAATSNTLAGTSTPTLGASGTLGSITFGNATTGLITLQPVTGALGTPTLLLPAAADTLIGKATTDILTNKTYDTAATGNSFLINGLAATANSGTGAVARVASPTFTGPTLGAALATSINGNTFTTGTYTLTGGSGKTLTFNNSITLAGTDATTWTGPSTNATLAALNIADQTLSGGANVTASNLGTKSSGTTTIDCGTSPLQYLTNGGAFTLAAPASDGSCVVMVTNNGSAGAITFSGFTVGATVGDTITTTNTSKFSIHIWRVNSVSGYRVAGHQ